MGYLITYKAIDKLMLLKKMSILPLYQAHPPLLHLRPGRTRFIHRLQQLDLTANARADNKR